MDPVSAIGLVGSVVGIIDVITKSVAYLSGLHSSYKIADLKVRLLIGQLSTLKAALDQVANLINSRPNIPRDHKLVSDLSIALTCVEAVIFAVDDQLSDLQRNGNQGLNTLSKVGFVWDEQTINDYLSLLNNQVNALNLFLTALQCRTTIEQAEVVEGKECQGLLRLVRDDTSSLLWLRDSESIGTYKSTGPQDFGTINATFDFDTEIFASKVYRTATRSSMLRTLLLDASPDGHPGLIDPTLNLSARQVESDLHAIDDPTTEQLSIKSTPTSKEQPPSEDNDDRFNIELQPLFSPIALPKYTIYTLEALQKLPLVTAPPTASSLPNASQKRARRRRTLLTRPWLARPSSPSLDAVIGSLVAKPTVKTLVMGISESGKSTLIKSLKAGYMGGYEEETCRLYKTTILRNLWDITRSIAQVVGIQESPTEIILQQEIEDKRAFSTACDLLKRLTTSDVFDQNVSEISGFGLPADISSAIQTLWREAQFYQVLEKAMLNSLYYVMDNANYYRNALDRILNPNYVPSVEDILYCRTKTTGIFETRLIHDDAVYHLFDLGGVRSERKKWIWTFEDVNAIIFTCDVSCYDAVLLEDGTQNRMVEQLILFESVINSKWFINSQIVVLFTKEDKLTPRKLIASPFRAMFPDYSGHPESVEDILDYLVFRFRYKAPSGPPNIVFCRSESIASSATSMAEVAINALQKGGSFPT